MRERDVMLLAKFEHVTGTIARLKEQARVLEEAMHANTEEMELLASSLVNAREAIRVGVPSQFVGPPEKLRQHVRVISMLLPKEDGAMLVNNLDSFLRTGQIPAREKKNNTNEAINAIDNSIAYFKLQNSLPPPIQSAKESPSHAATKLPTGVFHFEF
jgi:hypothetical protein